MRQQHPFTPDFLVERQDVSASAESGHLLHVPFPSQATLLAKISNSPYFYNSNDFYDKFL